MRSIQATPLARFSALFDVSARIIVACGVIGAMSLSSCSVPASEEVVGKQWQVTAVYDDPSLPAQAPEGKVPPVITIGGQSYSATSACEVLQGSVTWQEEALTVGMPTTIRQTDCDQASRVFSDRFKKALEGDFIFTLGDNGLRMKKIGEYPQGTTIPGWSAVTTGQ